jgi:hypothetical protein
MSAAPCSKVHAATGKTGIGLALRDSLQPVFQNSFGENSGKEMNS